MADDNGANDADFITPDDGFSASEEAQHPRAKAADAAGEGYDDTEHDEDADTADGGDDDLDIDDDAGDDDQASDEEFEEIEHAGKKHKIPKDLKPLLMMQQDYTRKTQEVSEHRKALEQHAQAIRAQEQAIAQQAEAQKQNIKGYAQLANLDERLQEYANVDWDTLEQKDPFEAQKHWRLMGQLKEQRQGLAQQLHHHEQQSQHEQRQKHLEAQQAQKQEFAKRAEETLREVQRDIKGWNEQVAGQVSEYAQKSLGYSPQELMMATGDPRAFKVLWKAWKFDQAVAKKSAAKSNPAEQVAPLTNVKRGRTAPAPTGLDDRLSPEEWVRRRNEQERKRAL